MTDDEVSVLIENINRSSFEDRVQQEVVGYFETLDTITENHAGSSSGDISNKLAIPLPTVKKTLVELLNKKVITKEGVGRATGYYSL
jgi:hypothetical protein